MNIKLVGGSLMCLCLVQCAGPAESPEQSEATAAEASTPPGLRALSRTPARVPIARVQGYGNPVTGELWARAVPLATPASETPAGVGVSAQALVQSPGYCSLTVESDDIPNSNPLGTFEFYTQFDATMSPADASSFDPMVCHGRLGADFKNTDHSDAFGVLGVGCALQHVGNFTAIDFDRVLLDVDVYNGGSNHYPYGPPYTDGTVLTGEGRNAPQQDLGLWDFGPMAAGTTKEMWIYFQNGDTLDFNWSGFLLGEVYETCGNMMDDDCDGVVDNGCGTVADAGSCYSDYDCVSGYCAGAAVTSGIGDGGDSLAADVAGSCQSLPTSVSAGLAFSCRVEGGLLDCWGINDYGQATAPSDTNYVSVSAGSYHACALKTDGSVDCWGLDINGETFPPPISNVRQVVAGELYSCALLDDGTITCWGDSPDGSNPPAGTDFTRLSAGYSHACALRTNGSIKCWGSDYYGEGMPPAAGGIYTQLANGDNHGCAVEYDQSIDCWGDDGSDQAKAPTDKDFIAVSGGYLHSCGLRTDGSIECWGDNLLNQTDAPLGTGFVTVDAGYDHTCAAHTDGSVQCWGYNEYGQLAPPVTISAPLANRVGAGFNHGCAILDSGAVTCWGAENGSGALGGFADQPLASSAPTLQLGASPARTLAVGGNHACAIFDDTSLRCWGSNAVGQAYYGMASPPVTVDSMAPEPPLLAPYTPIQVVAGESHACILLAENGIAACWGDNTYGQAGSGNGMFNNPASFTFVPLPAPAVEMCARKNGNCALLNSGDVYCWGEGNFGQNGYGDEASVGYEQPASDAGPVSVLSGAEIAAGRTVDSIRCGAESACAILDNGGLRCWGQNNSGELGYGTTENVGDDELPSTVPLVNPGVPVAVTDVFSGLARTCALDVNGGVRCWGYTEDDCLGHGPVGCSSPVQSSPPAIAVDLGVGRTAVRLAQGPVTATICATLDDGGVKCWGYNGDSDDRCGIDVGSSSVDPPSATYTLP